MLWTLERQCATGAQGEQYETGALGGQYEHGVLEAEQYVVAAWCGVGQDEVLPYVLTDGGTEGVAGLEGCWLWPRRREPRPLCFLCPRR